MIFSSRIPRALKEINATEQWIPDVIHLNDWPTGYVVAELKRWPSDFSQTPILYTIHNGKYTGSVPWIEFKTRDKTPGDEDELEVEKEAIQNLRPCIRVFEDTAFLSLSEVAIAYADSVNTVSPTYAQELLDPERLAIDVRSRKLLEQRGEVPGILNGIDGEVMNPLTDKLIARRYDPSNIRSAVYGKSVNKRHLQDAFGLPHEEAFVVSMIARLSDQKGADVILRSLNELANIEGLQLIVAGTAGNYDVESLRYHSVTIPSNTRILDEFIEPRRQHLAYAGSDAVLMFSRYEPCGYLQTEGMRYGAFPITTATGGLKDTVQQFDGKNGNGVVIKDHTKKALIEALVEAKKWHDNGDGAYALLENALASDFRWDRPNDSSVDKYIALYDQIIAGKQSNS
jgi:starch synthase